MSAQRPGWDEVYAGQPPWDIGRPQPALQELAEGGEFRGGVLDAGCGTGEHALLAARLGLDATGVDISTRAIDIARHKASERGLAARFEVGDALDLAPVGRFDTVVDSGLFHTFDDRDRARYVDSLAAVTRPGGTVHLMCFSDRQPGDWGPRRVREDELRDAFAAGWTFERLVRSRFEVNLEGGRVHAWLASVSRTNG